MATNSRRRSTAAADPVPAPAVVAPDDDVVELDLELSPPFRFRLPGQEKIWVLPSLRDLPLGIRRELGAAATPIEQAKRAGRKPTTAQLERLGAAQLRLLDDVAPGLADQIPMQGLAALLVKWGEHSGLSLGELPASV